MNGVQVIQILNIALQAYAEMGGSIMSLIHLRETARREGRDLSPEEIQALLDEAQAELDHLQADIEKGQNGAS